MATLTIRNLPESLVVRLKRVAVKNERSMEEEVRQLLLERYASRKEIVRHIRESWKKLPKTKAKDVDLWIEQSRDRRSR